MNNSDEVIKKRIVLDVDVGSDDYLALLIFLYAEQLETVKIEAIICTNGNTTVENVCRNVVRLLEVTNRTDIPVYRGANEQLLLPREKLQLFHGQDGFGDLNHDREPDTSIIKNTPGAVAMYEIVKSNPKEITLVCLGPLTNLALSLKLFKDFSQNVKEVWMMGGNYTALGNITPTAEFNFYFDPEAAYIALECTTAPIYILTWEACLQPNIPFEWRFKTLAKVPNKALELLTRAEQKIYETDDSEFWLPCDAFLAAACVYSEIIVTKSIHHASVELNGSQTRGQMVLDHLKKKKPNVTVIEKIDEGFFKKLLIEIAHCLK